VSKKDLIINSNNKKTVSQLQHRQSLPLVQKIPISLRLISQFYIMFNGKVYVSFSGGKDSTVLVHLVRTLYPDVEIVFVDTGLEFDSIRKFVKTFDNCTIIKPKMRFDEIIKTKGYPVVSKEISRSVSDLQNPTDRNERTRRIRLEGSDFKGGKSRTGMISFKWQFLKDAPFKCSDTCCNIIKKNPAKEFTKSSGKKPFIGTMAGESSLRKQKWTKFGCNMFGMNNPQSAPLSFWTEKDIWDYINMHNLPYADIYDKGAIEPDVCSVCSDTGLKMTIKQKMIEWTC